MVCVYLSIYYVVNGVTKSRCGDYGISCDHLYKLNERCLKSGNEGVEYLVCKVKDVQVRKSCNKV